MNYSKSFSWTFSWVMLFLYLYDVFALSLLLENQINFKNVFTLYFFLFSCCYEKYDYSL